MKKLMALMFLVSMTCFGLEPDIPWVEVWYPGDFMATVMVGYADNAFAIIVTGTGEAGITMARRTEDQHLEVLKVRVEVEKLMLGKKYKDLGTLEICIGTTSDIALLGDQRAVLEWRPSP